MLSFKKFNQIELLIFFRFSNSSLKITQAIPPISSNSNMANMILCINMTQSKLNYMSNNRMFIYIEIKKIRQA